MQQRQEVVRDLEDLVLQGGVEHHRDAAADAEEVADVRQPDPGGRTDGEHAGDARVRPVGAGAHDDQAGRLAVGQLRVADAEGELGGCVDLELRRIDAEEESALQPDEVGRRSGRPNAQLPDELEREALRPQREGADEVGAAGAEPRQCDRLDMRLLRRIDLEHALGEEEDPVGLERREVRLEARDAPELR